MEKLTTNELREKISNGETFLLDLYATWCGPCQMMLNNLRMITESEDNKNFKIYKYDIDSDRDFVIEYLKIRSVPTIKIFKEGKEVFSRPGVMSITEVMNEMLKH
jgi:thiol-disulfide isomerase/thioredoxin